MQTNIINHGWILFFLISSRWLSCGFSIRQESYSQRNESKTDEKRKGIWKKRTKIKKNEQETSEREKKWKNSMQHTNKRQYKINYHYKSNFFVRHNTLSSLCTHILGPFLENLCAKSTQKNYKMKIYKKERMREKTNDEQNISTHSHSAKKLWKREV